MQIEGTDVAGLPPHKRPTNTVFQSYALFPHLSVSENVAFGLKRKANDSPRSPERSMPSSTESGSRNAPIRSRRSSGGMQRVALARALVNLPKVLLFDEPLGALDQKLRKGLQVELKRIQRDVGITFVYVTYDQEEALTMSDRIAVMNHGRIEQVASAEEVYERLATAFVAGFIGVSNLMPGEVMQAADGRGRVRLDTGIEFETAIDGIAHEPATRWCGPKKWIHTAPRAPRATASPASRGSSRHRCTLFTSTQIVVALPGDVRMTVLVPNAAEAEWARLREVGPGCA